MDIYKELAMRAMGAEPYASTHELRPYDPAVNTPTTLGQAGFMQGERGGDPATEYSVSPLMDGGAANIPSIWFDQQGNAHMLPREDLVPMAKYHEAMTGLMAPRFPHQGAAIERAIHRSAMGGASHNPLFEDQ